MLFLNINNNEGFLLTHLLRKFHAETVDHLNNAFIWDMLIKPVEYDMALIHFVI